MVRRPQPPAPPPPPFDPNEANPPQTALFNFQSLLLVILLLICTSTYAHSMFPAIMDRNKDGYVARPSQPVPPRLCSPSPSPLALALVTRTDVSLGSLVYSGSLREWGSG